MKKLIIGFLILSSLSLWSQNLVPPAVFPQGEGTTGDMQNLALLAAEYMSGRMDILVVSTPGEASLIIQWQAVSETGVTLKLTEKGNVLEQWEGSPPSSPKKLQQFLEEVAVLFEPHLQLREAVVQEVHYQEDEGTARVASEMLEKRKSLGFRNEIYLSTGGGMLSFPMMEVVDPYSYSLFPLTLQYFRFKEGERKGLALYFDYQNTESGSDNYDTSSVEVGQMTGYSAALGFGGRVAMGQFSSYTGTTFGMSSLQLQNDNYSVDSVYFLFNITAGMVWNLDQGWMIGTQVVFHINMPADFSDEYIIMDRTIYSSAGSLTLGYRF